MSSAPDGPRRPRPPRTVITRIEIPIRTIVTVVLAIGVLWLVGRLWHQILLFVVALLIALAVDPAVMHLQRRGWRRGSAVGLLLVIFLALIALPLAFIVPRVILQAERLINNLPTYVEDLQALLRDYPEAQTWVQNNTDQFSADPAAIFGGVVSVGTGVFSGLANLLILVTIAIYLMLEGPRLFDWLTRGLSPSRRARAWRVRTDVSHAVGGWVRGQAIVSTMFAAFTFVTLSVVGTPEPLLLAVLAGLLDAVPTIGATLATIPAVLLTLTVSVPKALIVLVLYVVYQQVENYIIVPRVYRGTLQIPSLAVLMAVVIGGALLGITGALLALPIAAAVPAVVKALRDSGEGTPTIPELAAADDSDEGPPA